MLFFTCGYEKEQGASMTGYCKQNLTCRICVITIHNTGFLLSVKLGDFCVFYAKITKILHNPSLALKNYIFYIRK